jgi:hypothetical protein
MSVALERSGGVEPLDEELLRKSKLVPEKRARYRIDIQANDCPSAAQNRGVIEQLRRDLGSGPFKILHVQEVKMCPCGFYSNEADTAKHHGWCSKSFDISYLELTLQANGSPERVNGRFFEVDE